MFSRNAPKIAPCMLCQFRYGFGGYKVRSSLQLVSRELVFDIHQILFRKRPAIWDCNKLPPSILMLTSRQAAQAKTLLAIYWFVTRKHQKRNLRRRSPLLAPSDLDCEGIPRLVQLQERIEAHGRQVRNIEIKVGADARLSDESGQALPHFFAKSGAHLRCGQLPHHSNPWK